MWKLTIALIAVAFALTGTAAVSAEGVEVPVAAAPGADFPYIKYLSSCLWNEVDDIWVEDGYAYCAFHNGVLVFDVSDPAQPEPVSSMIFAPGKGRSLYKKDNYLYMADGSEGLRILDVSDPHAPVISGTFSGSNATDVFVQDSLAYVLSYRMIGRGSLEIVNIKSPASPVLVGRYWPGLIETNYYNVSVQDTMAYISYSGDWFLFEESGFQIVNVADPASPVFAGDFSITGGGTGQVVVQDSLAYESDVVNGGIGILKVSQPSALVSAGGCGSGLICSEFCVRDTLVFACGESIPDWDRIVTIENVADPAHPSLLGSVNFKSTLIPKDVDIFVEGGFAYTAGNGTGFHSDGSGALEVFDVSDPTSPEHVGGYEIPSGRLHDVCADGAVAVVVARKDKQGGIHTVDITNPSAPVVLASYPTTGEAYDACIDGNRAYVAGSEGLQIIDISDPADPRLIGSYATAGYTAVFYRSGLVYTADGAAGLRIVDVSNPAWPDSIGSCDTPGDAQNVFVSEDIAYVADATSGLQIISVGDPTNPFLIATYDTPGSARDVSVRYGLAYVADATGGLQIIDVTNRATPFLTGSISTPGSADRVSIQDTLAYITSGDYGLLVVNIADPENPLIAENYFTPGAAVGVCVQDSTVLVADVFSLLLLETDYYHGCCVGLRGNVNNDPEEKVNVSDIAYLISYLFGMPAGPEPPCREEGNANGDLDEKINMSDLTYLVAYLFGLSGQSLPPPACP